MFIQRRQILPAWIILFIIVIFGSFPCVGSLGEEEERPIHSFVRGLEREKADLDMSFPEDMDTLQIERHLIPFLREQGFNVPSSFEGESSTVTVTEESLRERTVIFQRSTPKDLAPVLSVSTSKDFEKLVNNAAYTRLLELRIKRIREEPADFLSSFSPMSGVAVLCAHPQDVNATLWFLSLLYDTLDIIRRMKNTPIKPRHQGLMPIFRVFEEQHIKMQADLHRLETSAPTNIREIYVRDTRASYKEQTLDHWGAFLLRSIRLFYDAHYIPIKWEYIATAWEPIAQRLDHTRRDLNRKLALNAALPQEEELNRTRREFLSRELKRAEASHTIAAFLTTQQGSDFKGSNHVKGVLENLIRKLCDTYPSQEPSFNDTYVSFNTLLEFTAHQVNFTLQEEAAEMISELPDRTLPSEVDSSLPFERQLMLRRAQNLEINMAASIKVFGRMEEEAQQELKEFEYALMQRLLPPEDAPDYALCEKLLHRKPLSSSDQERLQILWGDTEEEFDYVLLLNKIPRRTPDQDLVERLLLKKPLSVDDQRRLQILWDKHMQNPLHKINHLNLQESLDTAKLAVYITKLKHHIADLRLAYLQERLLLDEKKKERVESVRSHEEIKILRKLQAYITELKKTTATLIAAYQQSAHVATAYEQKRKEIKQKPSPTTISESELHGAASPPEDSKVDKSVISTPRPTIASQTSTDPRIEQLLSAKEQLDLALQEKSQDTQTVAIRILPAHLAFLSRFQNVSFFGHPFITPLTLRSMITDIFRYKKRTPSASSLLPSQLLTTRETIIDAASSQIERLLTDRRETLRKTVSFVLESVEQTLTAQTSSSHPTLEYLRIYFDGIDPIGISPLETATEIFVRYFTDAIQSMYDTQMSLEEVLASLTPADRSSMATLERKEESLVRAKVQAIQSLKRTSTQRSIPLPSQESATIGNTHLIQQLEEAHGLLVSIPTDIRAILQDMISSLNPVFPSKL